MIKRRKGKGNLRKSFLSYIMIDKTCCGNKKKGTLVTASQSQIEVFRPKPQQTAAFLLLVIVLRYNYNKPFICRENFQLLSLY